MADAYDLNTQLASYRLKNLKILHEFQNFKSKKEKLIYAPCASISNFHSEIQFIHKLLDSVVTQSSPSILHQPVEYLRVCILLVTCNSSRHFTSMPYNENTLDQTRIFGMDKYFCKTHYAVSLAL